MLHTLRQYYTISFIRVCLMLHHFALGDRHRVTSFYVVWPYSKFETASAKGYLSLAHWKAVTAEAVGMRRLDEAVLVVFG